MAITNHERVGKAMHLLRAGLAPYAEREFRSLHKVKRGGGTHNGLVKRFPEIGRLASEGGKSVAEQAALFGVSED